MRAPLLALLLLAACKDAGAPEESGPEDESPAGADSAPTGDDSEDSLGPDADGDGYNESVDCDEDDPQTHPDAEERCDGRDNDCDGAVDEEVLEAWYTDADGDGWGSGEPTQACTPASGQVAESGDCDDGDPRFYPGAPEDECADPNDYNCDGSVGYADADGDGFAACEECDDLEPAIHPGATELCDSVDNDCDSLVDEPDAADASAWYTDADGDGYGDPDYPTTACDAPAGYVEDATDCDDGDAALHPGAAEICDSLDNDCDSLVDDADPGLDTTTATTWYIDDDGDGYGDATAPLLACDAGSGAVVDATDCDDTDSGIHPAASELCDSQDNNCDGVVDEDSAVDATTWYADADADAYGDPAVTTQACDRPAGYRGNKKDCDDTDSAVNPAATEICDSLDNDCDSLVDDDDPDLDTSTATTWYTDADGDGYGVAGTGLVACVAPSGTAADATDCNDTSASDNPTALDPCDGVDNNCDGLVDEGSVNGMQLVAAEMSSTSGTVYSIDPATATATTLSTLSTSSRVGINTVTWDANTGDTYVHDYANSKLWSLDVCDGTLSEMGATGVGNTCGIVVGPGGLLYGLDSTNNTLVTLDPATGAGTTVGSVGLTIGTCGLAYDCATDTLVGVEGTSAQVFAIDPSTGAAYNQTTLDFTLTAVGIEYNPLDGQLYVVDGDELRIVNPSTGTSAVVGAASWSGSRNNLSFVPECAP